ncbi:MAG: hypothetical protein JXA78_11265 [Anaerolineales bacterium]|nr:hypothetical protein [Anaerolineales bacterium]
MNNLFDSLNVSHMYFDPHNEPLLPLGDWSLLAALSPRGGGSAYRAPAGGLAASDSREAPASRSDAAWNPPKFAEPRTIPVGWDVSALG